MRGAAPFSSDDMYRVGWYIDGFNLYHSIEALKDPALKWLDLYSLASSYIKDNQVLFRVMYSTALNTWDSGKRQRHSSYIKALEARGVDVIRAKFEKARKFCKKNNCYCQFREEKQSDVNLAVQSISDLYENKVDTIFFLTADTDQIPTFKAIKSKFDKAKLYLVAPPGRLNQSNDLSKLADKKFELTAGKIRQHLLPERVLSPNGRLIVGRPEEYKSS